LEEEVLAPLPPREPFPDGSVVGGAVLDGVVEDGRVRGEPGHRQLVDVAPERALGQEVTCDVVEPDALSELVQLSRGLHLASSVVDAIAALRGDALGPTNRRMQFPCMDILPQARGAGAGVRRVADSKRSRILARVA